MTSHVMILSPLPMESRAIKRRLALSPLIDLKNVSLHTIGVRASGLARISVPTEATIIILAGLGGGLNSSVRVGDVVIEGSDRLDQLGAQKFRVLAGPVCMSETVVATVADKRSLCESSGAMAVDMECDTVRQWAADGRKPVIVVRAISDTADQPLPVQILRLFKRDGSLRPSALLPALWRPRLVGELFRLRRGCRLACENLAVTVSALVEALQGSSLI